MDMVKGSSCTLLYCTYMISLCYKGHCQQGTLSHRYLLWVSFIVEHSLYTFGLSFPLLPYVLYIPHHFPCMVYLLEKIGCTVHFLWGLLINRPTGVGGISCVTGAHSYLLYKVWRILLYLGLTYDLYYRHRFCFFTILSFHHSPQFLSYRCLSSSLFSLYLHCISLLFCTSPNSPSSHVLSVPYYFIFITSQFNLDTHTHTHPHTCLFFPRLQWSPAEDWSGKDV